MLLGTWPRVSQGIVVSKSVQSFGRKSVELPLLLWQGRTGETRVIACSRILPTLTVSSAGFLGIGWNSILHSCKAGAASCRPHPKQRLPDWPIALPGVIAFIFGMGSRGMTSRPKRKPERWLCERPHYGTRSLYNLRLNLDCAAWSAFGMSLH